MPLAFSTSVQPGGKRKRAAAWSNFTPRPSIRYNKQAIVNRNDGGYRLFTHLLTSDPRSKPREFTVLFTWLGLDSIKCKFGSLLRGGWWPCRIRLTPKVYLMGRRDNRAEGSSVGPN